MKFEEIDIKHFFYSGFSSKEVSKHLHIKTLPYLSVVQSKVGSYSISLDGSKMEETGEGGFFIAPSACLQRIMHYNNTDKGMFSARFVFVDVVVNGKYHLDDIMDFPMVTDAEDTVELDSIFDEYEKSDDICDKKCCEYKLIKKIIEIGKLRKSCRNEGIYGLREYIAENYMNDISVAEMAGFLNMSESNLFAVFKKATGVSPLKFLNDYRLSVAGDVLIHSDESIKCIAEKVGISDQFYFSRIFKRKYMVSPQEYRKRNKV